jgi:hypothetical protein
MNTVPEHLCSPMVFKIYYYFGLTWTAIGHTIFPTWC